jgi:hypothetical protein
MRLSSVATVLCALGMIVGAGENAFAQRSFGSRNNLVSLAANDAVQKDLGVEKDVAGKLAGLSDEYRSASEREFKTLGFDFSAISDLPSAERAVEMKKVADASVEVMRKLAAAFLPKLEKHLTPDQIARLQQIQLQAAGVEVWTEPLWAKELDLSDAQKDQLTELRSVYSRRVNSLEGDFTERIAKTRELNTERDTKALELLDEGQRAKLAALKGQAFDVSQLGFRRRGNN